MITPEEVYFLQDLVLFLNGVRTPEKVRDDFQRILRGGPRQRLENQLQEEADRLHHGIEVREVLARAQV